MQPNDQSPEPDSVPVESSTPELDVSVPVLETETVAPTQSDTTQTEETEQSFAPEAGSTVAPGSASVEQPVTAPVAIAPEQPSPVVAAPIGLPPESSKRSSKKKVGLILGIVGLIVLLGGGAAAAYVGIIVPNQPDSIAGMAMANTINTAKVQSSYFEGDVSFEGGDVSKSVSGLTFKGATNQTGAIDLNVSLSTVLTKVGLDLRSQDGKTLYVKLSGLNGIDKLLGSGDEDSTSASIYTALLAGVNDKWFSIEQSLLNQYSAGASSLTDTKLSDADTKKVTDIYKKHHFLHVDKKLEAQDIHGVPSYHFQASINKTELVAFLNDVKAANISSLKVEQSTIDEVNKVDFSKYPFEMWVSKKDKLITQLATTIDESGTKYKVRVALYDFNKTVTVEKPANSQSILELLGGLSSLGGGSTTPGAAEDLLMTQ